MKGTRPCFFDTKSSIFVSANVKVTIGRVLDSGTKDDTKEELFMYSLDTETLRIDILD